MPRTFSARSAAKRLRTRRPLAVEALEGRDVPATFTWTPTAPGTYSWNDAANWGGAGFPNAIDDVANLTAALVGNQHVNLNVPITVGTLNIGSTTATGAFTVVGSGGSLTFNVATGSAALTDTNSGGDAVLAPITVSDPLTISGNGGLPLALGVTLAGSGTITTAGTIALASGLATAAPFPLNGSGTITSDPSLFVESFYDSALYQFNARTGDLLAALLAPNSNTGLQLPAGLTTGPDGNLYLSSQNNDTILKFDRTTNQLSTFLDSTTLNNIAAMPSSGGNAHFAPAGLRFGPDGKLYVSLNGGFTSAQGAVIRFDVNSTGGVLTAPGTYTLVAGPAGVVQPSGLTFGVAAGDTGNLYFSSSATGSVVKVTGATGATPTTSQLIAPPNNGGLEFPTGLAFGPDGKLYVADLGAFTGAGKVVRFNADGTAPQTFVASGTGANPGDLAGQFPSDLLFDAQGNLITANLGPNGPTTGHNNDFAGSVYQYDSSGGFVQALVASSDFPQTGPAASFSGIIPSQLSLAAAAAFTIGSNLNPAGAATGVFTTPAVTFTGGGGLSVTLNGTSPGGGYDQLAATGPVALNGATLTVATPFAAPPGSQFTIVSAPALSGTFAGLPEGATVVVGTQQFTISYVGGTGHSVVLTRVAATAPTITGPTTATFFTGAAPSFTVTATGSPAPTFSVAGGLPPGLSLNATTGAVTGTPTATGTFTPSITATNASGSDTKAFTFTVQAGIAPAITSAAGAMFTAGTGGTFTVTATGTPAPTLAETAPLPSGVTFDPVTGVLTVAPTALAGSSVLTFTATNGVGTPASQTFALTIGNVPTFTSPNATAFATGTANSFAVVTGGSPTPTLSETGALPTGVTFDAATGTLSGTPAAATAGTYPVTFSATNLFGTTTQSFTLTVQAAAAPVITSPAASAFKVGQANTFAVTATGTPTPTLTLSGTLPTGVTFNASTGVLSGTPTAAAAGTFPLTFTATSSSGAVSQNFTLTVGSVPAFTSATTVSFATGTSGAFNVTATGAPSPTLSVAGTLPAGVTFNAATGQLSVAGTTAAGTYPLTFTAANAIGTATQNFTLTVRPGSAPAITSANTALFGVGATGSFSVTATGTPTPTLAVSGALPTGVTFNASTGVLSGTPAAGTAGTYPLTITATNGVGTGATQGFTLTVQSGATGTVPAFTSAAAATFAVGTAGSFAVTATGTPTPTLSVAGALPAGLTFNAATGLLTGTPAAGAAGVYQLTFTATNSVSTASQTVTVTVTGTPVALPGRLAVSGPTDGSVTVFDPATGGQYPAGTAVVGNPFAGLGVQVRTAVADVDGDGTPDTIYVTGPGVAVQFAVVNGKDNTLLVAATMPYEATFTGGGFVSAADLDGDGRAEIVVTPDQGGGPRVTIFGRPTTGTTATVKANFLGIDDPTFRGGARSAIGDINADGTPDLAVAAGFLGGPRVSLLDGKTLFGTPTTLVGDFFAFPGSDAVTLRNGAYVAVGDVDGDGFADLIFGGGPGGGPRVYTLSGKLVSAGNLDAAYANPVTNFFVAGNTSARGGVRVGVVDADGDGRADIAAGSGSGLPGSVRVYFGKNVTSPAEPIAFQDLNVFGSTALADGVYVG
ncbi:beta strand repeat-containing protein [Limnoglobus roseus]|uniref:Beta-propeller repeat protein n=1 Tax=Limnoglobus roseus TaxID=2598579 RepID=A0A5C1AHC7_9BACT|nr:putative Ig domain-containing protein [Limnoglobus roseus]QEL16368.1 beta-propeller repeat protein [Limnoglobus roseus]